MTRQAPYFATMIAKAPGIATRLPSLTQNAFIKSLNSYLHDEVLNETVVSPCLIPASRWTPVVSTTTPHALTHTLAGRRMLNKHLYLATEADAAHSAKLTVSPVLRILTRPTG